jgi:hypothetical protein
VKKEFARRIASALDEVSAADRDLTEILRRIRVAPRAEKTTISNAVELALSRLRVAQVELLELRKDANKTEKG